MTDAPPLLAKVQMPEKGVFAVRCPHAGFAKGQTVVVNLGYGPDLGTVLGIETYDSAVHGASVPGYQLVRAKTDEDARTAEANAASALKLRAAFLPLAQEAAPDVRILHARLSLGRYSGRKYSTRRAISSSTRSYRRSAPRPCPTPSSPASTAGIRSSPCRTSHTRTG